MRKRGDNRNGIKLVEVVVILLLCAVVLTGLFTLVPRTMEKKIKQNTIKTGTGIYKSFFAGTDDPVFGPRYNPGTILNPDSDIPFENSTDYFRYLIETEWFLYNYSLLSIPGRTQPIESTNSNEFTAAHNGWNVSKGLFTGMPAAPPFMFTRKLEIDRLGQNLTDCELTFWSDVVIITKGGEGKMVSQTELRTMPHGFEVTNQVLRP